ncbi:MAG TPA: pitrilysin family protein [Vicinamibacterales bacterium]|nr:pitrilysin family protein [Vicinamibacterales bacterium]
MRRTSLAAAAVCLLCAAAAAQTPVDRSKPPAAGPAPALKLPPIETRTLSNGLQVRVMGVRKVPTVHVALTIRTGVAADPAGKFGLASLTADMLDEGAGSRNALEIADAIDFLGADLSASGGVDATSVELHVPVARLADALPLMADVVVRPTFPEAELNRLREERLAGLLEMQDDPEQLITAAFPRLVFGAEHRYGSPAIGTPASLKSIAVSDLEAFHAANIRPANAVLVVAGDVTADGVLPQLERAFGGWKGAEGGASPAPANPPAAAARRVYLIDTPGAAQSQIRIGGVGVPRSTPDYFALRVLNTILGEAFTSRLNTNLREVHGYAYGAASRFDMRLSAGPFYAAAGVQTDKTAEALKEFFVELNRIHEPVPSDELEKAKNYLALLLPRNFETTRGTAASLAQAWIYNLPADYYTTYADRVRAVTAADVKRAADKYIVPGKVAVVIVGDRKAIEPGVKALNLGPLTVVQPGEIFR